jgi:hypothetical protein
MEETKRPLTEPEMYKRVTVSTGHLPESVDQALTRLQQEYKRENPLLTGVHFEVGRWAFTGEDGYWELTPAYTDWSPQDIRDLVRELDWGPSGVTLLTWAFLFCGADCLRLDSDGPVMDGLQLYDW